MKRKIMNLIVMFTVGFGLGVALSARTEAYSGLWVPERPSQRRSRGTYLYFIGVFRNSSESG